MKRARSSRKRTRQRKSAIQTPCRKWCVLGKNLCAWGKGRIRRVSLETPSRPTAHEEAHQAYPSGSLYNHSHTHPRPIMPSRASSSKETRSLPAAAQDASSPRAKAATQQTRTHTYRGTEVHKYTRRSKHPRAHTYRSTYTHVHIYIHTRTHTSPSTHPSRCCAPCTMPRTSLGKSQRYRSTGNMSVSEAADLLRVDRWYGSVQWRRERGSDCPQCTHDMRTRTTPGWWRAWRPAPAPPLPPPPAARLICPLLPLLLLPPPWPLCCHDPCCCCCCLLATGLCPLRIALQDDTHALGISPKTTQPDRPPALTIAAAAASTHRRGEGAPLIDRRWSYGSRCDRACLRLGSSTWQRTASRIPSKPKAAASNPGRVCVREGVLPASSHRRTMQRRRG